MPGLYVFSASVSAGRDTEVQASIMKNSQSVSRLYSKDLDTIEQGSVAATMSLETGDEVYARCDYPPDTTIHGNGFTSFAWFLLSAF